MIINLRSYPFQTNANIERSNRDLSAPLLEAREDERVFQLAFLDVLLCKPWQKRCIVSGGILTSISHSGIVTPQLHLICNDAAVSITLAVVNACKISARGE